MKEKAIILLSLAVVAHALPTTIVNFSPVGDSPNVAPGFAYAFRSTEPLGGPEAPVYLDETEAPANEGSPKVVKTQYHSQDQLGQYAFGYVGESSTKHEIRTADGAVRGSFSYLDSAGVMQTANYVADKNGYRVEASNLPQGPNEVPTGPVAPVLVAPKPVQYTPEVLAARNAHFKAFEAVKAAAAAAQAKSVAKSASKKEAASTRSKRSNLSSGYLPPPPPPKETKKYTPLVKKPNAPAKHFVAPSTYAHVPPQTHVNHFVAPAPLVHLPHSHDSHALILDGHVVHAITPVPKLRKFFLKDTITKSVKTPKDSVKHTFTKQIPLDGHIVHAPVDHIISPVHSVHEAVVHNPVENTRQVPLDGHIVHAPVPQNTLLPPAFPIHGLPAHRFVTPIENSREILLDGHIVHAPVPYNTLLPPVYEDISHVAHTPVQQTREVFMDGHIVHAPIPVNTILPPFNSAPNPLFHPQPQQTREVVLDRHIVHAPVPVNSLLPPVHSSPTQFFPAPIHQSEEVLLDGHIVHHPVPFNTLTVPTAPGSQFDSSIDYLDMPFKHNPIPSPLTHQSVFVRAEPEFLEAVQLAAPSFEVPLAAPLGTQVAQQVLSQFHSQDELGGFEFGYSGGPSSRHESRDHNGITRGSYSYVDANGELQTVQYIADDVNGFRVQATNLPEDPASISA